MNAKSVGSTGNGGGAAEDHILIRDEKAAGVDGGTFVSGVWQTRDLNVEVYDTGNHASLSSNQITLAAGAYRVEARCTGLQVAYHKCKLRNITDSADLIIGDSSYSDNSSFGSDDSFLEGRIVLPASKVLELQHQCHTTVANIGYGAARPGSFSVIEVYSIIKFTKES